MSEPACFVVPHGLLQSVLNYLAGKPYLEVHELVRAIQALQPMKPLEEAPKEPTAEASKES